MAREQVLMTRSRIWSSATIPVQYTACCIDTAHANSVVLPSAGAAIYGVVQTTDFLAPNSATVAQPTNQVVEIYVYGLTKMLVGTGGLTEGDKVMVDSSGQAVLATGGNFVIGWSEDTVSAGNLGSVLLMPGGKI